MKLRAKIKITLVYFLTVGVGVYFVSEEQIMLLNLVN